MIRVTRVTTVTCVTRVTWVTCVTMMSGSLFSRMTRVFKYEDKLKNTNDSSKEKEIINSRAIYTRENKPRLSLTALDGKNAHTKRHILHSLFYFRIAVGLL